MKRFIDPSTSTDSLGKLPQLRKIDIRFGTWNERSQDRADSLIKVAKELSKYKLDLVRVRASDWKDLWINDLNE
jgi:hypothetical protein